MALTCKYMSPHGQTLDAAYVKAGVVQIHPLFKTETATGIESNHFVLSCQLNVFASAEARKKRLLPVDQVPVSCIQDTSRPIHEQIYAAAKLMRLEHIEGVIEEVDGKKIDKRKMVDDGPVFVDPVDVHE